MIGTVRMITNESQQLIARHDYVAFGEEIPNGSADRVGNFGYPSDVTQGFTGQEADGGTAQLDFFNARHLAAVTGAFAQPDPGNAGSDVTQPQSWNAYALGDPLGTTDPMGLFGLGQVHDDSGDDGGGDEDGDNPYEAPPCTACDSTGVYFKVTVTDHSRKASPTNPLPPNNRKTVPQKLACAAKFGNDHSIGALFGGGKVAMFFGGNTLAASPIWGWH